jgi:hypothetical protein
LALARLRSQDHGQAAGRSSEGKGKAMTQAEKAWAAAAARAGMTVDELKAVVEGDWPPSPQQCFAIALQRGLDLAARPNHSRRA